MMSVPIQSSNIGNYPTWDMARFCSHSHQNADSSTSSWLTSTPITAAAREVRMWVHSSALIKWDLFATKACLLGEIIKSQEYYSENMSLVSYWICNWICNTQRVHKRTTTGGFLQEKSAQTPRTHAQQRACSQCWQLSVVLQQRS